ncbi:MAG: hypothetical protein ACI8RD_002497 [Bacillariaceae sp.]
MFALCVAGNITIMIGENYDIIIVELKTISNSNHNELELTGAIGQHHVAVYNVEVLAPAVEVLCVCNQLQ